MHCKYTKIHLTCAFVVEFDVKCRFQIPRLFKFYVLFKQRKIFCFSVIRDCHIETAFAYFHLHHIFSIFFVFNSQLYGFHLGKSYKLLFTEILNYFQRLSKKAVIKSRIKPFFSF